MKNKDVLIDALLVTVICFVAIIFASLHQL